MLGFEDFPKTEITFNLMSLLSFKSIKSNKNSVKSVQEAVKSVNTRLIDSNGPAKTINKQVNYIPKNLINSQQELDSGQLLTLGLHMFEINFILWKLKFDGYFKIKRNAKILKLFQEPRESWILLNSYTLMKKTEVSWFQNVYLWLNQLDFGLIEFSYVRIMNNYNFMSLTPNTPNW